MNNAVNHSIFADNSAITSFVQAASSAHEDQPFIGRFLPNLPRR